MVDRLSRTTPWHRVVAAMQRVYQPSPSLDGFTPCWTCGSDIDCLVEDWVEIAGRGFHPACADLWEASQDVVTHSEVVR